MKPTDTAMSTALTLITALMLTGAYVPRQGDFSVSRRRRRFQICYTIVLFCFLWFNVGRLTLCFRYASSVNAELLMNVSLMMFFISLIIVVTSFVFISSSKLPQFLQALQKLHGKYGQPSYLINGRQRLKKFLGVTWIFNSTSVFVMSLSLLLSTESQEGRVFLMTPITMDNPALYYGMMPLYLALCLIITSTMSAVIWILGLVCYVLYMEFSDSTAQMRKMLLAEPGMISSCDVERARLRHGEVAQLVSKGNSLVSSFLLVNIFLVVPLVCLDVYSLATESYSWSVSLHYVSQIAITALSLAFISLAGAAVSQKARELVDDILQVDFSRLSEAAVRSMNVFLFRLAGTHVGISAGGLFYVDIPLFLTILGSMVSYTVVVFQFRLSAPCNHGNSTGIIG